MEHAIDREKILAMQADFLNDLQLCARMNAVTKSGIDECAESFLAPRKTPHTFSIELEAGKVTSQHRSGRCWLFAVLNVMRAKMIREMKLDPSFELSQSYLFFWDKLEKANHFLENILRTLDLPGDDRLIHWLLTTPFEDGGQWDMLVSIIQKYGVVPKTVMPETASSMNSGRMNKFLTLKAREYAALLREGYRNGETREQLSVKKERMLAEIFKILCISLGTPPDRFTFEIRNKDDKFYRDENLTPLEFYSRYVRMNLDDNVSLINAPTQDKPFYATFTVEYLGNVEGGKDIRYLNLPIDELKEAALRQLEDGEPVWFGSDVGQMLSRKHGLMAMDAFDYETLFCTEFPLDKAHRLDYCESLMTHAMVITGANVQNGKADRWKVENSWGSDAGEEGWYRMSDAWFSEYVYQVVVNKKYLTDLQKQALQKTPIILRPWDPMGALA